jgi:hypothetical protein
MCFPVKTSKSITLFDFDTKVSRVCEVELCRFEPETESINLSWTECVWVGGPNKVLDAGLMFPIPQFVGLHNNVRFAGLHNF